MTKTVNECVGCPQGCVNCGRKRIERVFCDMCSEEISGDIYERSVYDELCESCLLTIGRKKAVRDE